MIKGCNDKGLKELEFIQEDVFKLTIWRDSQETGQVTGQVTGQASGEVTGEVSEEVNKVILVIHKPMKRSELQKQLHLSHRENFYDNYLNPALKSQVIELLYPDSPNHPKQKYKLTARGIELQKLLEQDKTNE